PGLINPANNFYNPVDSVFFSWNPVSNVSSYELNIAEDAAFSMNNKSYKIYNRADTSIKNIVSCKTYFWRVRAFVPAPGTYSTVRSFTVFTPLCIPSLELWLDASSGLVTNGSNEISEWKDRSGKNRNALQPIAGTQPLKLKETAVTSNKSS